MLKLKADLCEKPFVFARQSYRLSCEGSPDTKKCPGEVQPTENVVVVCSCSCHG